MLGMEGNMGRMGTKGNQKLKDKQRGKVFLFDASV